jgi:hypothetical protein
MNIKVAIEVDRESPSLVWVEPAHTITPSHHQTITPSNGYSVE